jgi:hypothetical protein
MAVLVMSSPLMHYFGLHHPLCSSGAMDVQPFATGPEDAQRICSPNIKLLTPFDGGARFATKRENVCGREIGSAKRLTYRRAILEKVPLWLH